LIIYISTAIPEYSNELAELARAFYPGIPVKVVDMDSKAPSLGGVFFLCKYEFLGDKVKISIEYFKDLDEHRIFYKSYEINRDYSKIQEKRIIKNQIKLLLYDILEELTGRSLDWGSLTGIGPTKILHGLLDKGFDDEGILKNLYERYRVSQKKAKLLLKIARVQRPYFENNHSKKISVYINIPICTTKCLYCSFPSATIETCGHLIDDYILALGKEMEAMSIFAREKGIEIETVYIGGGTPTSINLMQLKKVLEDVQNFWAWHNLREYTVEGGRPDSLDKAKLRVLKDYDVSRISINPQSMSDKTLNAIGRNHSSDEIIQSFQMARDIGFESINMDVIVGLPGEGVEDALNTMKAIEGLSPDNFTVHTLAVKRASRLKDSLDKFGFVEEETATRMMETFERGAISMGMRPYYLYRQKYMLGNMENIGFAIPTKECIYNMQMMEDKQTIWAFGAGAITKVCYPSEGRIERAANVKNMEEYIKRVDEMIERKMKLTLL
jgi:coproporphyrinogen dehydrogenase HemZ